MHDKWLLLLICDINTLHAMWPYFQHNKNLLSICISKDCPTCAVIAWNAKVSVTENNQKFISYNANFTLGQLGAFCSTSSSFSSSALKNLHCGILLFTISGRKKQRGVLAAPVTWLYPVQGRMCSVSQDRSKVVQELATDDSKGYYCIRCINFTIRTTRLFTGECE